jgi:hypothetical protein
LSDPQLALDFSKGAGSDAVTAYYALGSFNSLAFVPS